jgi:hypothetical protein
LHAKLSALLRQAEDISLVNALRIDPLRLRDKTQGVNAVTNTRGIFKRQSFRSYFHCLGQFGL